MTTVITRNNKVRSELKLHFVDDFLPLPPSLPAQKKEIFVLGASTENRKRQEKKFLQDWY